MSTSGNSQPPHNDQGQAPLIEHLIELRSRLMKAVVVILVIFLGLYAFANDIYTFVAEPLMALLPEGSQMIATEVASPFMAPFKLTLVVAVFIAIPFVLHQAWAFVAPGLYDNEKALAIPILVSSVALFYAGAAFAYYVVFPLLFEFFTQTGPENVAVMTDINQYLNFVLKLFFAFGVAFEIPIATFLLILSGATTVESLSKKRPYIILGCFVVGMLLTPPDVISQSLLAVPMYLLYEVGLLFGRLVRKPKTTEEEQTD
ncbi:MULTISPECIES: twin-arginine translocase subunit TatC [Vreelandella]|uniref:Sec-independent protein translocase protein TatC n=2 Tax=Halomonadaceae TaxID=28256 RepID=A0ABQ2WCM7_9GAMM|nr:twin-arginine translocase subunit TatC [Halomonas johnsoniae]NGO88397.1 twin-arginine translocase subunit TatC [Halomonas sp.]GGW48798.1 Sec-independent protein translocase protein TatC [Halomonas johnsoniae]